jgi:hypothetical protein
MKAEWRILWGVTFSHTIIQCPLGFFPVEAEIYELVDLVDPHSHGAMINNPTGSCYFWSWPPPHFYEYAAYEIRCLCLEADWNNTIDLGITVDDEWVP